jgi:hypothetical protein
MGKESEEKAIQEIWGFMRAYDDPSVVFGSSIVVLCAIRDVIDKLNLPSSKDIGNRAVLESLPVRDAIKAEKLERFRQANPPKAFPYNERVIDAYSQGFDEGGRNTTINERLREQQGSFMRKQLI